MVDAHHTGIFGDSGTGKTSLMREVFHLSSGVSLWVNHNEERGLGSATAKTLEGLKGERSRRGDKASLVLEPAKDVTPMMMAATAMQFCRWHSSTYGEGVRVIFDEAHHVMPEGDSDPNENPVAWGIHEGRDDGIVVNIMSQTPRQLEYQPMYNLKYWVWVGPPSGMHGPFLNNAIASWIPREELPDDRFEYVVLNNQGEVVFEGETKEKYS